MALVHNHSSRSFIVAPGVSLAPGAAMEMDDEVAAKFGKAYPDELRLSYLVQESSPVIDAEMPVSEPAKMPKRGKRKQ